MMKVACVGILVADAIVERVSQYPKKGAMVPVNSISMCSGGNAMTASINLQKLGVESYMIGMIGNDMFGSYLKSRLVDSDVDISGLKINDSVQTSSSIQMIDEDGERSYFHCKGTNAVFSEKDIDYSIIEKCDMVFLTGSFLMDTFDGIETMNFLKKCKEMGKITFLDVCFDASGRWGELLDMSMPYIDFLMPSIDEAMCIAKAKEPEDIADIFVSKGAKNVIIKLGSKGSFLRKEGELKGRIFPSYKVDNPVDTVGAGDSFCSGFLAAYSRGKSIEECMITGNAVGSQCVCAIGATTGIKTYEETIKFIKEREEK